MTATIRHFSPRASLAAIGLRLRRLRLLEAIASTVQIPQKTVRHRPAEKLYDAFITILAGAHGLCEINTCLRADESLQRALDFQRNRREKGYFFHRPPLPSPPR
jgi:hypothetical protein